MEIVALLLTIVALGGMVDVYIKRWPTLSRTRRVEQQGYALLLVVIIFGLAEIEFADSRWRFFLISLAMSYLFVSFLVARFKQRRGKRDDRN